MLSGPQHYLRHPDPPGPGAGPVTLGWWTTVEGSRFRRVSNQGRPRGASPSSSPACPGRGRPGRCMPSGPAPESRPIFEPDNEEQHPAAIHAKRHLGRYPVLRPGDVNRPFHRLWTWILDGAHEGIRARAALAMLSPGRQERTFDRKADLVTWTAGTVARDPRPGGGGHRSGSAAGGGQIGPPPAGRGLGGRQLRRRDPRPPAPSGQRPGQLDGDEPAHLLEHDPRDAAGHPGPLRRPLGCAPARARPGRTAELADRPVVRGAGGGGWPKTPTSTCVTTRPCAPTPTASSASSSTSSG